MSEIDYIFLEDKVRVRVLDELILLQDGVMVLFDFGNISNINELVLKDIDGLMSNVYARASAVKAICRNMKFFDKIQSNQSLYNIQSVLKQI